MEVLLDDFPILKKQTNQIKMLRPTGAQHGSRRFEPDISNQVQLLENCSQCGVDP